jgi:hypothetical protein
LGLVTVVKSNGRVGLFKSCATRRIGDKGTVSEMNGGDWAGSVGRVENARGSEDINTP